MTEAGIAFDKQELSQILKSFKAMDEEATKAGQEIGFELAKFADKEIKAFGYTRTKNSAGVRRVVDGSTISKTSKIGEIKFGFARQRFSGGGTTQKLWPGLEFGSNKFKQFPTYSGRFGRGSRGWFIYPTLRRIQPELVAKWQKRFAEILDEWNK